MRAAGYLIKQNIRDSRRSFKSRFFRIKRKPKLKSTNEPLSVFRGLFPKYENPVVSIIVLTYNGVEFTHQCLDSILKKADVSYELIIVDNNSKDDTRIFLEKLENVKIIYNKENVGFGAGCNQGVGETSGKYLLFLNNDTIVTKGWLSSMLRTIENIKVCGAVGAKLVSFEGVLLEAGSIILRDGSCRGIGRGDIPSKIKYSYRMEVDYCSGACLMINRRLFISIGGFDGRYSPAYYEDSDMCMEIKTRGYKVFYEPSALVYHNEQTSSSAKEIIALMERNRLLFLKKWAAELSSKHIPSY